MTGERGITVQRPIWQADNASAFRPGTGRVRWVAALVAGILACGSGDHAAIAIDTSPSGVVWVRPVLPLPQTERYRGALVPERTIVLPADGPEAVNSPSALATSDEGVIHVLDDRPARIQVFDAQGNWLRTIGREGSGPGEFRPFGMIYVFGDTVVHQDPRQSRATVFDDSSRVLAIWQSQCCQQQLVRPAPEGIVPIPGPPSDGAAAARIIRFSMRGDTLSALHLKAGPEPRRWEVRTATGSFAQGVPFQPDFDWRLRPDGSVVWGSQDRFALQVSHRDWDTTRVLEAIAPAVPLPPADRAKAFEEIVRDDPRLAPVARLSDIPREYPAWETFMVDGANRLWVLSTRSEAGDMRWTVFDSLLVPIADVEAPFRNVYGTWWAEDRVYQLDVDDTSGANVVRVWRMDLPSR